MQSEEGIRRRAAQACQLLLLPSLLFSNLVCQIVSGACLQYDPSCNPALGYIVFQAQEKSSSCSPACPSNYICVPATSQAANQPWVNINQTSAKIECTNLGMNYHLVTNSEWMTIARNIETTASNWSGAAINSGAISSGHNDNAPASSLAASADNDGCSGTGQACSEVAWNSQRRTHTLSNGAVIWDIAGNVSELNDWQVSLASKAYFSTDGGPVVAFREFTVINTFPLNDGQNYQATSTALNSTQGIGQYYSGMTDPGVAVRGGNSNSGVNAGVFSLNLANAPTDLTAAIGFRCARH